MKAKKKDNKIITIFGQQGQGKTAIASLLIFQAVLPTIIIDPLEEFSEGVIFSNPIDLWNYLRNPENLRSFYKYKKRLILQFPDDSIEAKKLMDKLYWNIFLYLRKILIVIDELDLHFHPNANSRLSELFKFGRNRNISIISTSKRPTLIHNDAVQLTTNFIIFNTATPEALEKISKYWNKEVNEKLKNLDEKLEFLAYKVANRTYTIEKITDDHWEYISMS